MLFSTAFAQTRTQECFQSRSIEGYKSIEDMNLDMQDIVMKGTISGPYTFTFCPLSTFIVDEPLRPLLSDSSFVCGTGDDATESCVVRGGQQQVVLQGYLFNVTFKGLDFDNFQNTSVTGNASTNSTALFDRCRWRVSFKPSCIVSISYLT